MYCLAEVSPLRFRCTECQDIELCPCPGCFSAGAEIRRHHHHHHRCYRGYQLMDGERFTLWGPEAMGAGPAARSSCCWMPPSSSASGTGRTWQLTRLRDRVRPERQDAHQQALRQLGNDVEIELKRAHVDMSVCKFRERQPCKNIARDYNLVPAFLGKDKEKERRRGARSPR
ncbi:hypothetical protein R6Z07F_015634 [Ovis aries]